MRNKNIKNKLVSVYLMFGMILLVIGFSYAFFIYNKTGLYTHTITGGKMKVIYDETTGNNILIENAYPRTDVEALTYGLEFEFTVTGYNESEKNVYYAIEMDYGNDLNGKNRFLDTDIKLSLFENSELVFENEIFNNLDNQDIHYNYFKAGTSSQSPTVNNYKLRLWINDNVIISDTLSNNLNDWGNYEWEWLYESYPDKYEEVYNGDDLYLSDYGISIYTSDEFSNSYANFKVNIKADLTYDDIGYLTYDANGGEFTPKKSSLLTGRVTTQKPVMEGKGFLGWSSNPDAEKPEYKSGDDYYEDGKILYAVYGDTRNVMGTFPEEIISNAIIYEDEANDNYYIIGGITEIYFYNDTQENIDYLYNLASIKADVTYNNQGSVKCWLESSEEESLYYTLYVASEGTTYLTNCEYLFTDFPLCGYIDLSNVDTSQVTSMKGMFEAGSIKYNYVVETSNRIYKFDSMMLSNMNNYEVQKLAVGTKKYSYLEYVDLEPLNTANVTDMSYMFKTDYELSSLDVSNFDTSKVTDMSYMFDMYGINVYEDSQLYEIIGIENFDTSNVKNMLYMFNKCYNLVELDLSAWNVTEVTDMSYMFARCEELTILDLGNFDTIKVTDMSHMFDNCVELTILDLSNFDTENVTTMNSMFSGCVNLTKLSITGFDTRNVGDMSLMFNYCRNLTDLDVSNFDTENVTTMRSMFEFCESLENLDVSDFGTSQVTTMETMFYNCKKLKTLDLSNFDTNNVTSMYSMFGGCSSLTELDVSHFDISNLNYINDIFKNCSSLVSIDVSTWDTSNATLIYGVFNGCSSLKEIDLSAWNFSSLIRIGSNNNKDYNVKADALFNGCTSLEIIDISSLSFTSSLTYQYVFYGAPLSATVYVKDATAQSKILGISTAYRPAWTTNNVIVKNA